MKKARRETPHHLPLYPASHFTTPLEPQAPNPTASINHPDASPHVWYVMSSGHASPHPAKETQNYSLLHIAKMTGLFLWRADVDFAFAFSR
jgi:hypothetical protein